MSSPHAWQTGLRRDLSAEELGLPETTNHDAIFAALVQTYARLMYRIAYAVLRNPHDAEDAVQDVFVKILRSRPTPEQEKAYLSKAAYRAALDRLPRKDTRALEEEEEFVSPALSQEEHATALAEQKRLRLLIAALPEELRQPLVLMALEELTSREVADLLGIPEGTVRTRAQRAREELRRRFERRKP